MEKTKKKLARFGRVDLEIREETGDPFIPTSKPYKENGKILETIAYATREDMPILLVGETGVGKTSAVRYLAAQTNTPLRRVNVNGSMTAEDFIGQILFDPVKGTYWKDGVLTEAVRKGYWIVIDEINAASAEILFSLHSLLDDDRYLVLTDHPEREIVKAHPSFRLFATMNPPERYAGTKELNRALLSRFPITLTVPIPSADIEYGEISGAKAALGSEELGRFKAFVTDMRNGYKREELDVFISPRDVANIVRVYLHTGSLTEAVALVVSARGSEADRGAIEKMATLHLTAKAA